MLVRRQCHIGHLHHQSVSRKQANRPRCEAPVNVVVYHCLLPLRSVRLSLCFRCPTALIVASDRAITVSRTFIDFDRSPSFSLCSMTGNRVLKTAERAQGSVDRDAAHVPREAAAEPERQSVRRHVALSRHLRVSRCPEAYAATGRSTRLSAV